MAEAFAALTDLRPRPHFSFGPAGNLIRPPVGLPSVPVTRTNESSNTMNTITLAGNMTRDPEIRHTRDGQTNATFALAVNRRWQNRQTQAWEELREHNPNPGTGAKVGPHSPSRAIMAP